MRRPGSRHAGQRLGQRQLHGAGLQRRVPHHRLHGDGDRHHPQRQRRPDGHRHPSPINVTGLTNGDSYTFTVTASNGVGTGPASGASSPVVPVTVPGAPTGASATRGNASASVSFDRAGLQRRSTITGYTVTATDHTTPANGGQTATGTTSPITVTGLTNGDSYTFTVTATNGVGTGPASGASNAVTPATVPGAPTGVSASAGQGQATSLRPAGLQRRVTRHRLHRDGDRHDPQRQRRPDGHGLGQPDQRHGPHQRRQLHLHGHRRQRRGDRAGLGRRRTR